MTDNIDKHRGRKKVKNVYLFLSVAIILFPTVNAIHYIANDDRPFHILGTDGATLNISSNFSSSYVIYVGFVYFLCAI